MSSLANCQSFAGRVEIASFNNTTGTVSNPFIFYPSISSFDLSTYGAEFSATGKTLYVTTTITQKTLYPIVTIITIAQDLSIHLLLDQL